MIRNAIGSLIALVGAAVAVWSVFLPWYGGREGQDFALRDLFTPGGLTEASPALFAGLFLPVAVAALLTVIGVLLRSRLLVALAALVVLGFAILWMIRQGVAQGSLTVGGSGGLDWGLALAFAGAVILLFGALFMAGRRGAGGRGRHRGAPDTRLRRRSPAAAGAAAAGTAGLAASTAHADDRGHPRQAAPAADAGDEGRRTAPAGTGTTAAARPVAETRTPETTGEPDPERTDATTPGHTPGTAGTAAAGAAAGTATGAAGMAAARRDTPDTTREAPSAQGTPAGVTGAERGSDAAAPRAEEEAPAGATAPGMPARADALDARGTSGPAPGGTGGMAAAQQEEADISGDETAPDQPSEVRGEVDTARQDGRTMAGGAAWSDAARRSEESGEATEGPQERTRPMPHTAGTAAAPAASTEPGAEGPATEQPATEQPVAGAPARSEGAGMGTFPRDERADWSGTGTATRSPGPAPAEPAQPRSESRPLAGAGAGGPTRSGDLRAEKGPDAMRPEEAPKGTAPEAERAHGEQGKEHGREPFPQRLLHRLQNAGHRGHHGPRGGGDHRDVA
ncbi:hypothetical protein E4198_15365 [Streptomyces sp. RKND-216]|uniref:hypothetical protein n=1 Tax=Streptomyces sp. RKND-216 TaxID=2562581 RepID=UPI00109D9B0A|nr:hypothetical protein [Streptomyces sp. RKND-216]THA25890.1 hypothetical protein E4198_15365 [Streptomyces sp. RKND-216]